MHTTHHPEEELMANVGVDQLQAIEWQKLRLRANSMGLFESAGGRLVENLPERATDTVIVKVRRSPAAVRRIAGAFREISGASAGGDVPWLAKLIANNLAERVTPVFQSEPVERAARGAMAAMAEAMRSEQNVKAARGLVSIKVAPGVNATQLAEHLHRQQDEFEYAYVPAIKYPCVAKRTGRARKTGLTRDALSSRQWAHGAIKIRDARRRATFKEATDVVVVVLDSGIDKTHPDLAHVIHSYINYLPNEDDRDYKGHGTHVSGIIAAEMNNGIGVAGVCAAKIMALKALPKRGNRWNAEAYYRALAHPIEAGAKILNMSIGGAFDPGERDIIADLIDAGVTVVAAMGNEYEKGNPTSYPAAYPGVVAVGASDEMDRRAAFSCTGDHITLVAPGERILSTTPLYPSEYAQSVEYDSWPGTSMATPHVAAAAALLLARRPNLTPAEVKKRLAKSADRVAGQAARSDKEYGAGRLNVAAALK
jgi:subtilisin family serine protease